MPIPCFCDALGRWRVPATITVPRLRVCGKIFEADLLLMLDTGADSSLLCAKDAKSEGLPYRFLRNETRHKVAGVTGEELFYVEDAVVTFRGDNEFTYAYGIKLWIEPPPKNIQNGLSILGRDILDKWRLDIRKLPTKASVLTPIDYDKANPYSGPITTRERKDLTPPRRR